MGKNCWRIVAANIKQLMKTWEQIIGKKETEGHKNSRIRVKIGNISVTAKLGNN